MTRRQLDEKRGELRVKDRDLEELQDKHSVELKVRVGAGGRRAAGGRWVQGMWVEQELSRSSCGCGGRGCGDVQLPCRLGRAGRGLLMWPWAFGARFPAAPAPCSLDTKNPQVYKQRVKHLLYEHQEHIAQLKADAEAALKRQQDTFLRQEAELGDDKRRCSHCCNWRSALARQGPSLLQLSALAVLSSSSLRKGGRLGWAPWR